MEVPRELSDVVEAMVSRRHPDFIERLSRTSEEVRQDFARRNIRGPGLAVAIVERSAENLAGYCDELLGELLTIIEKHHRLDDVTAQWLLGRVGRIIDGLGGALRSVPNQAQHFQGAPPRAKNALAERAERAIARVKNRATTRINEAVKIARLQMAVSKSDAAINTIVASQSSTAIDSRDQAIIDALRTVCPSAASAYEQGVRDLSDASRSSYRGPVTEIREALRETLCVLGPDDEVEKQDWYERVKGQDKPTMAQRAKYALRQRRRAEAVEKSVLGALDVAEGIFAGFVRDIYGRSNISTHTHAGKDEAGKIHSLAQVAFADLLGV